MRTLTNEEFELAFGGRDNSVGDRSGGGRSGESGSSSGSYQTAQLGKGVKSFLDGMAPRPLNGNEDLILQERARGRVEGRADALSTSGRGGHASDGHDDGSPNGGLGYGGGRGGGAGESGWGGPR